MTNRLVAICDQLPTAHTKIMKSGPIVAIFNCIKLTNMLTWDMRDILFYRTQSDSSPIEEFLNSLNARQARKVAWVLGLVEELDRVPKQYFKKLSGTDDIWEVGVKDGRETFRLLGFWRDSRFVVLVHAFKKKSQQIKRTDI